MKIGVKKVSDFEDYIIASTLAIGYDDITSVKGWVKYGSFLFKDYKFIRKQLQQYDFNLLTDEEKTIVCQYRATTDSNCKITLGDSFDYAMTTWDLESQKCRKERFSLLKTIFIKNVSLIQRYETLGFLNTTQLENNYLNHGIEGVSAGDPIEGLLDFINSTGSFLTTGISVRNYTMVGTITKAELVQQLINIINTGNIN